VSAKDILIRAIGAQLYRAVPCARRDCFGACGSSASLALGSPPLRSGDRHRRCAALSSNSLVFCREFELRMTDDAK
jgi:hypothetical protein